MTCGAAQRTATVASMVKTVNKIRQSLSKTMAANFQSPSTEEDSSSSLIFSVINFISLRIRPSSFFSELGTFELSSVMVGFGTDLKKPYLIGWSKLLLYHLSVILLGIGGLLWLGWTDWKYGGGLPRNMSSKSKTLASKDFDDISFCSICFIFFCIIIVFLVIFSPGRDILRNQGIHWRNINWTWKIWDCENGLWKGIKPSSAFHGSRPYDGGSWGLGL